MADRIKEFVLPSGIKMKVRNLKGIDQRTLTEQKNAKSKDTFNTMLADCTLQIGSKTHIDKKDIQRMLANDRRFALMALRQHSLRNQHMFMFKFEWPLDNRAKDIQDYEVDLSQGFAQKPYYWVAQRIQELKANDAWQEGDEFPVMFEDYSEVLEMAQQEITLPESGLEVQYMMLNGDQEAKWSNVDKESISSHTQIQMRAPKVILTAKEGEKTRVPMTLDLDNLDLLDIEFLRRDFREKEGFIDTFLTIQNQKDAAKESRVDLISTKDFFFPSQAI